MHPKEAGSPIRPSSAVPCMYMYLLFESTFPPLFLPSSNPSNHKILDVITSSFISIFSVIGLTISPVNFLPLKTEPHFSPLPIFSEITCAPKGVIKLFLTLPIPYAEEEIG